MKKKYSPWLVALMFFPIMLCFAFRIHWNSPVKGSVNPSNAGVRAWAISKTDTLSASIIHGDFVIDNVKPGNYTILIEGRPPYRNSLKQGVIVADGEPTDIGIIQMNQ